MKKWIRIFHPKPQAKFQLLCIPHAGGAASAYRNLSNKIGADIEVLSVQLPGRDDRYKEDTIDNMQPLVSSILLELAEYINKPFAIFGHSMGAYIGYELTKLLFERDKIKPLILYISAASSPDTPKSKLIHKLPDALLLKELKTYTQTPDLLLQDKKAFSYFLSYIRSDFKIVDSYSCNNYNSINCPVSVFIGNEDPHVVNHNNWSKYTNKDLDVYSFKGDHFYLKADGNIKKIIEIINIQMWKNYENNV